MLARIGIVILVAYAAVTSARIGASSEGTIAEMLLPALGMSPFVGLLWRAAITKVTVEEAGVRIVNVTRTRLIPWEAIERFTVGSLHGLARIGIVELRSGDRMGIWSIQGPNPAIRPNNRSAERLIDALNAELARHTADRAT